MKQGNGFVVPGIREAQWSLRPGDGASATCETAVSSVRTTAITSDAVDELRDYFRARMRRKAYAIVVLMWFAIALAIFGASYIWLY